MKYDKQTVILPFNTVSPFTYDLPSQYSINAAVSVPEIENNMWLFLYERYTYLHCLNAKDIYKAKGKIYKNIHISYPHNPFISRKAKIVLTKKTDNILEKVIKEIEKGNYIKIRLDSFYLPGYLFYNSVHNSHQEIVYGFDKKEKKLFLYGHTKLAMGKLEKTIVSFDDFVKAFASSMNKKYITTLVLDRVNIYSDYIFDINKLYNGIKDYYSSKCSFSTWLMRQCKKNIIQWEQHYKHVYGISVVKEIVSLIDKHMNSLKSNKEIINLIKYFQALYDFSNLMFLRVKYLTFNYFLNDIEIMPYDPYELIKQYEQVRDNYLIVRNLILRCYVVDDIQECHKTLQRAKTILNDLFLSEMELGRRLILNLEETIALRG